MPAFVPAFDPSVLAAIVLPVLPALVLFDDRPAYLGDGIIEELRRRVGIGSRIVIVVGTIVIVGIAIPRRRRVGLAEGRGGPEPVIAGLTPTYQDEDQSQSKHEFLHCGDSP